jgi:rare lipoprotein A
MTCFKKNLLLFVICAVLLCSAGCGSSRRFSEQQSDPSRPSQSYESQNEKFSGKPLLTLEGTASYYAHDFHGRKTSNGETYDMHAFTAAHRTFPFGTKIRVTNLENKKTVIVRVNDRGPFKEGRLIDLSLGAAKKIDLVLNGTGHVKLEVLEWGKGE